MKPARLRPLVRALPLLALLGLAGCASAPLADSGPVRAPQNVRGPAVWPSAVARIAVLPAHDASGRLPAEFIATYDASWSRALASAQRAELVAVNRSALASWTGRETLDSTTALPSGLLRRVAAETGAQAIMFLDLVEVSPYPPLSLVFRARLATAEDGDTLWMADEIFDGRDAATARAARKDARTQHSGAGDPVAAVEQSPSRFADHAFRSVTALLPPRRPDASTSPASATSLSPAAESGPAEGENALPAKKFPVRADNQAR